jgi:hypothetical protein
MEISINEGYMHIMKIKDSDITLHYTAKDKHSISSFNSIKSIEQQYNALMKTEKKKDLLKFNFNKINCDDEENEEVCKNKSDTLPQITFNNKYGQEFKIVGDIPKNRITKFIKTRNKFMKENKDYTVLAILYYDSSSSISSSFMNTWNHVADHLESNENIKVVSINCHQNPEICQKFDAIPHIQFKLQKKKENVEYEGDLVFNDIMTYISELLGKII